MGTGEGIPLTFNETTHPAVLVQRIDQLTQERDDYILKQKVWEDANDELRSQHIWDQRRIRALEAQLAFALETLETVETVIGERFATANRKVEHG